MELKLYKCDIETYIYVLAKDRNSAQKVADNEILLNASEVLNDCKSYAIEINKAQEIDSYFHDELPYMSKEDQKNPNYSEIIDLSCKEVMEIIALQKKVEEDKAYAESLQRKFQFMAD